MKRLRFVKLKGKPVLLMETRDRNQLIRRLTRMLADHKSEHNGDSHRGELCMKLPVVTVRQLVKELLVAPVLEELIERGVHVDEARKRRITKKVGVFAH